MAAGGIASFPQHSDPPHHVSMHHMLASRRKRMYSTDAAAHPVDTNPETHVAISSSDEEDVAFSSAQTPAVSTNFSSGSSQTQPRPNVETPAPTPTHLTVEDREDRIDLLIIERTGSSVRWERPGDRSTTILLASRPTGAEDIASSSDRTGNDDSEWIPQGTINSHEWQATYDRETHRQAASTAASTLSPPDTVAYATHGVGIPSLCPIDLLGMADWHLAWDPEVGQTEFFITLCE